MKYRYREPHEMKDSRIEWLGMIPKKWDRITLRRITSLKQGLQIDSKKRFQENKENRLPYITVKYLNSSNKDAEIEYIENADKGVICDIDEILMARTGSTGEVITGVKGVFHNNFFKVIYNKNKIIKNYLVYALKEKSLNSQLLLKAGTTTIPDLNHGSFLGTECLLFSKGEQQKIADFLDKKIAEFDEIIEKKDKLIEKLEEAKKSLISEVITGKKEVLEINGKLSIRNRDPHKMKDSGVEWLGMIPEEWNMTKLKYVTNYQEGPGILGKDFHEKGIPLIRISGVKDNFVTLKGCNYLDPNKVKEVWNHFKLNIGDLLVSASATTGIVAKVTKETEGAIPYTGLIRFKETKLSSKEFLYHFLYSREFIHQIDLQKTGSTIQHYGPTHLDKVIIAITSKEEQQKIANFLDKKTIKFNSIIQKNKDQIEKIKEGKQSLISEAVTGKIEIL